jgi:D-tyrosyl-tRNA(Tyr) deacylase
MEKCCVVGYFWIHLYIFLTSGLVSQFTLLASTKKGTKPDFHGAMGGEQAKVLYQHFVSKVKEGYQAEKVKDGVFQAMMEVSLINDGPVGYSK